MKGLFRIWAIVCASLGVCPRGGESSRSGHPNTKKNLDNCLGKKRGAFFVCLCSFRNHPPFLFDQEQNMITKRNHANQIYNGLTATQSTSVYNTYTINNITSY